jgi:hypothetical protein
MDRHERFEARNLVLGIGAIVALMAGVGIGWVLRGALPSSPARNMATTLDDHAAIAAAATNARASAPAVKTNAPSAAPRRNQSSSAIRSTAQTSTDATPIAPTNDSVQNVNSDAPPPVSDGPSEGPIDASHAMDLFADKIAKEEYREDNQADNFDIPHLRRKLEAALPNADATTFLRAELDSWLEHLPAEWQAHIAIVAAECRNKYCRVLLAVNSFSREQVNGQSVWVFAKGVDLGAIQKSLESQSWWQALIKDGFIFESSGSDKDPNYAFISYYFILPKAS